MSSYTFEVHNTRPAAPSRSQHAQVVEAVLATAGTTRSIVLTPGKGEDAEALCDRIRAAACTRVSKTKKDLRVRGLVQAGKVYLWCELKSGEPRPDPAPIETTTPTGPLDDTEARVIKALQMADDDGLDLSGLARTLYGRSDADRKKPALSAVLSGLCKRRLLLQDGSLRYTLKKGVTA